MCARLGATVVSSDGDDSLMDMLQRNIRCAGSATASRIKPARLRWGERADEQALLGGRGESRAFVPDLIIASDVIYPGNLEFWAPLVKSMRRLASKEHGTVVLYGHTARALEVDAFLELARQSFSEVRRIPDRLMPSRFVEYPTRLYMFRL